MAGLSCALKLAAHHRVALITKKEIAESNTNYAQGGIAAALSGDDSLNEHLADTLTAGRGLCHETAVRHLVERGPAMIRELMDLGARFSLDSAGGLDLGMEGGHSRRRIVHANDLTGQEIERALVARVRASPNIRVFENHMGVNLVTRAKLERGSCRPGSAEDACFGAYVIDARDGRIIPFRAKATILATGGCGKVYLYTSNPDIASGDGLAMAWRAGAAVANMEFMQFHPTCLYHPRAKSFLISEAVRGEGAELKLASGEAFMNRYHDLGSLAPRDVVARAIDREMKKTGDDCVYLDTRMIPAERFPQRFPNIFENLRKFGFDPRGEMIPVVPAAHYMCGGVVVDLAARTGLPGLFAIGEVAHTGVHGANRLASNSLLEAVVFADAASRSASEWIERAPAARVIPPWDYGAAVDADEQVVISHTWDEIRRLMWNYVGIVRTDKRLARAKSRIALIQQEIDDYYWGFSPTTNLLELRNLAVVASLVVECALRRKESRGLHYNMDYPDIDDANFLADTALRRWPE
ncbi:MAG: L-aspartate oxidase [Nitrospinae bacterium]|nr:L-aspartate oxidase [Nitrospinota bacterium]